MKVYKVLGLMSGTSLDGLDLAYCQIRRSGPEWEYEIMRTKSIAYDADLRVRLKDSIFLDGESLILLHNQYGVWLGQQAGAFIDEENLEVDFISSHGHTSHHQPQKGLTFQLGSGQHLATVSGIKTISDFRTLDVALGGQGAPLVPIGDRLLFGSFDYCLNLGGISNISFERNDQRIAFDIGLANMLLNYLCRSHPPGYDDNGAGARMGTLHGKLLSELNGLGYYALPFPKSTGYEWFLNEVIPVLSRYDQISHEDKLHTGVHHICEQIAVQLKQVGVTDHARMLITGGGALNGYLIQVLRERLGDSISVEVPSRTLIEFKEALIFALMGVLRIENKINVLRSVTGAARDSSSGVIYLP